MMPSKKNNRIFALFLSAFLLVVSACVRNTGSPGADEKTIAYNSVPERIISAAPSNTEIVTGLGLGERLIAVDRYSKNIAGVPAGLPEIDFFYPDTEAVIALEPDIILVNEINRFGAADNPFKLLGDFGIKVVPVSTSTGIEGIYNDIIFIAETLGVRERGEALAKSMKNEMDRIAPRRKEEPAPSVYFEISAAPSMTTFGQGTYLNEMIELAGGRNIFAGEKGWFSPGAEEIISKNPDVIFALAYPGEDPVPEIMGRKAFEGISAVREKRVYSVDADSASRPSQNIVKAFRIIAAALNN